MATLLRTREELSKALSEGYYILQGRVVAFEDKATEELKIMVSGSMPTNHITLGKAIFIDFDKYLTWRLGK